MRKREKALLVGNGINRIGESKDYDYSLTTILEQDNAFNQLSGIYELYNTAK